MEKKTALVTGSSRGIGKAIALKLASCGYQIIINSSRSGDELYKLKYEIENTFKVKCMAFVGNIADTEFVSEMFSKIDSEFGGVDVLVNNAGISHIGLLSDMSFEEWNNIISTNLSSVFYCSKLAIPHMVHNKSGAILNISSVWGNVGASCEVAYSAAKGGINAFTKALAKELAPSNIQVNAIACGCIDTQMNACFDADERAELEAEIPAGRYGTPEEVAELAYSIISGSSYLTAQIITLDGGWI